MAKITVVGMGPGAPEYILPAAVQRLNDADTVMGGMRNVEAAAAVLKSEKKRISIRSLNEMTDRILNDHTLGSVAVAVSGDAGFYSALDALKRAGIEPEVIPGISTFQYFYARLGRSYWNVSLLSLHGREARYIEVLKEGGEVFLLMDRKHTPALVARELTMQGLGARVAYVGEDLSYPEERITRMRVDQLQTAVFSELRVMVIADA